MTLNLRQLLTPVDIDKKLALILLGLGLIVLVLAAIVFGSLLVMQASITVILASGVYLLLRRRRGASLAKENIDRAPSALSLQPRVSQLLDIAFWGISIASLILISQQAYARPLSFLVLVSIMAAILAVEIFTGKNTSYCLVKVLIIAVLLRASVWYQFPGPVGRDPIIEMDYVRRLIDVGHIGTHMGAYHEYPVAHILTAFTYFITGLGLKDSFFILGIIEAMSLVFLFLIGRQLFNEKIGLIAALIMAVCNWHILWGFWLKGMTLGVSWLPILLFLLLAWRQRKGSLPFLIFSILIIFLLVLTHTVSSLAIITIVAMLWLSSLICKGLPGEDKFESPVTFGVMALSFVALLGYWMYVSGSVVFFKYAFVYAFSMDVVAGPSVMPYRSAGVLTLQKLSELMLIFLAILGSLSLFSTQKFDRKALSQVWIALASGGMVILTFLIYYIGVLGTLQPTRWFVFMSLLLAIPAANGLLSMLGRNGRRNLAMLFLMVLLLSGIMTTSYEGNITQVVPWVAQTRDAFISSEMAAAETVGQMAGLTPGQTPQEETEIHTDYLYRFLLIKQFHLPQERLVDASPIFIEELTDYHGILMLRSAVTDSVLMSFGESHLNSSIEQSIYQALLDDTQAILIYDNGIVKALKKTSVVLPESE